MNKKDLENILIFTDGACSGNPGVGGYGAVIVFPEGEVQELGGKRSSTTNNRMELTAVIDALTQIRERAEPIWVLTDSTYVIRGITQWIWGWKKKNWHTSSGAEVTNIDLWKSLHSLVLDRSKHSLIEWKYVRGHTGVPGNERCDEIAVSFTKGKYCDLYNGPLLNYTYAIYDIPDDLSLPPMRDKVEKKSAYSYLSYVNGQLLRHKTWPECEAQVKGRSGAKFKKATSDQNEKEIIRSWGLNPKTLSENED